MRSLQLVVLCRLSLAMLTASCGARSSLAVPDDPEATDAAVHDMDVPIVPPPDICDDAGVPYIYVVTEQHSLYSYYPPTNEFTRIGTIACPSAGGHPFSMAVDRVGTAYVEYYSGGGTALFRVSTRTAQCEATTFNPAMSNIPGYGTYLGFGMGFVADLTDPGETLYVASDSNVIGVDPNPGHTSHLATLDIDDFALTAVNTFSPVLNSAELTGTGDGRLYAFSSGQGTGEGSIVAEIDRSTARIVTQWSLPTVSQGDGWAFASWGGAFYLFTGAGTVSSVTRFRPEDGSVTVVQSLPEIIVGAGVSTCAPTG